MVSHALKYTLLAIICLFCMKKHSEFCQYDSRVLLRWSGIPLPLYVMWDSIDWANNGEMILVMRITWWRSHHAIPDTTLPLYVMWDSTDRANKGEMILVTRITWCWSHHSIPDTTCCPLTSADVQFVEYKRTAVMGQCIPFVLSALQQSTWSSTPKNNDFSFMKKKPKEPLTLILKDYSSGGLEFLLPLGPPATIYTRRSSPVTPLET